MHKTVNAFITFCSSINNKVIYTTQIRQGRKCAISRQFWRGGLSVYL